jgi:uncharacterized protein YcaQ
VIAERLTSQLLSRPAARDPVAVAERLLAIQGQDPRGARLAIRARTEGLVAGDVDRALTEDRSLVITWLNRGTLHLVRSEDYPWLHSLTTPPLFTANARRLAQEGVTPGAADRGVAVVERSLASEGPLTSKQLRERLDVAKVRTEGQALAHIVWLASLRGILVRGPMVGKQHAYVLARDWLGNAPRVNREKALAELARRYLAGHGPADARDLAKWAGLPLRDARAGLAAIAPELEERGDALFHLKNAPPAAELPPPRLLGAFDPVLLGWTSREDIVGSNGRLIADNGLFRPFALVGGRAVGTWSLLAGEVVLTPFGRLTRLDVRALDTDAADVTRFLAG